MPLVPQAVAHFWAPWCEPCALLDRVLDQLAHDAPSVRLIRVEAEEAPEVSERHGVTVVPLFKFFARGAEVDSLEGADPAALSSKFVALAAGAPAASASGAVPAGEPVPAAAHWAASAFGSP
jgi:thioredoxin-like negative regulator of GroEL